MSAPASVGAACLCYVSLGPREDALAIGRALVEERLAAAVNVLRGVHSIYRWQGAVEEAPEVLLIAKTRVELVPLLSARAAQLPVSGRDRGAGLRRQPRLPDLDRGADRPGPRLMAGLAPGAPATYSRKMFVGYRSIGKRALHGALDLVLPTRCLGCGTGVEASGRLCPACWRALTFLGPPQCRLCGYPLPHALPEAPLCGGCAADPPAYDRARAALRYDDGSRRLILAFKHADRTDTAPAFGRWLARAGAELLADADLVAPVPLHRWRLLRRGYNQAAILAQALARGSGVTLLPDLVQRIRATASQQGLGGRARLENITAGAFRAHPWHRRRIEGATVLLVDDVLTTGATVEACARVLRRAGAAQVDVLTLARVVRDASHPL